MQLLRLVPQGTWEVGETLKAAGEALVRGGQTKVSIGLFRFRSGSLFMLCYSFSPQWHSSLPENRHRRSKCHILPHYAHNIPFNAYGPMFRFREVRSEPLTVPLGSCMIDG